jgi:hypothetical protein
VEGDWELRKNQGGLGSPRPFWSEVDLQGEETKGQWKEMRVQSRLWQCWGERQGLVGATAALG